jgi:hypothetical protein
MAVYSLLARRNFFHTSTTPSANRKFTIVVAEG